MAEHSSLYVRNIPKRRNIRILNDRNSRQSEKIAVVAVDSGDELFASLAREMYRAELDLDSNWIVETPLECVVENGTLIAVDR